MPEKTPREPVKKKEERGRDNAKSSWDNEKVLYDTNGGYTLT